LKPVFDKFNNDPAKGPFEIPDHIVGPDGKIDDSPVARGALELLHRIKASSPDIIGMWTAARDAGIRINPVDNDANGWLFSDPHNLEYVRLTARRNEDMAANILSVLNQPVKPGDPPRKGLAWLGNMHIADDGHGIDAEKPALQIVKEELAKSAEKTTTFFTQINSRQSIASSLFALTISLDRPVAVATHGKEGSPNIMGQLGMASIATPALPFNLDSWDNVIVFPVR